MRWRLSSLESARRVRTSTVIVTSMRWSRIARDESHVFRSRRADEPRPTASVRDVLSGEGKKLAIAAILLDHERIGDGEGVVG
jgi:hypothetical protein